MVFADSKVGGYEGIFEGSSSVLCLSCSLARAEKRVLEHKNNLFSICLNVSSNVSKKVTFHFSVARKK